MASLLFTVGFNLIISILSSGSLEILWAFLNIIQILDYIPILQLNLPLNLVSMFSYLSIANSNIDLIEQYFSYIFNLNEKSFENDRFVNENFNTKGFTSMKIVMNS